MPRFFSLGPDCQCAHQLKAHGLRREAGPFDWLLVPRLADAFVPVLSGEVDLFDGLRKNERAHDENSLAIEFTHHEATIPEVRAALYRRLDRLRAALTDPDVLLLQRFNVFDVDPRAIDVVTANVRALRTYLDGVGARARILTAIRVPQRSGVSNGALDSIALSAVACAAKGPDAAFVVFAPGIVGFDPPEAWSFLSHFKPRQNLTPPLPDRTLRPERIPGRECRRAPTDCTS